jgi:hypothetical protein
MISTADTRASLCERVLDDQLLQIGIGIAQQAVAELRGDLKAKRRRH